MLELLDIHPDVNVQESEYTRLLGYPPEHELSGRARELAEWARQWYNKNGKPWMHIREADGLDIVNQQLRINGTILVSQRLHDQLVAAQAHNVILAAVSAGRQCEEKARELWQEGKPDEYFFLEVYGSAVVEHLTANAGFRLCDWADRKGIAVLPHYSPGYPGWDISDQGRLLNLVLQHTTHQFPEDLQVLSTGMLQPKKSLLAVFGITSHVEKVQRLTSLIPCENCSLPACQYRRVPYKKFLPQIEDVRRFQSLTNEVADGRATQIVVLNPNASYSISTRALRKWSQERLHLRILDDQSVEARFRYEGTTCSNMGRPLEFDYHVRLGKPEERYKIIDANCVPAPNDTGHHHMCEYKDNAQTLMSRIADENPLLGRPLDDVLTWKRQQSPSGCYCKADSRDHKWGLVLEVLHFAMVRLEQQANLPLKQERAGA
jgi:hypothetical protein